MTKDRYYEMCEALGSAPVESEVPIDFEDLPIIAQEALRIYSNLQDNWDYFSGEYVGKSLVGFIDILDIYEVHKEDRREMYELIMKIDEIRGKSIRESKPKKTKSPS